MERQTNRRPLIAAAVLLGIGLGGFVDGILFHQILQWHEMLTHLYPKTGVDPETAVVNMQVNMFWDGLFHAFTWTMTVIGLALLWRAGQRTSVPWSTRTFLGSLALGWGLFNLVEGVIDHHVLHVHHVVEGSGPSLWDFGFLAFGLVLIGVGWSMIRSGRQDVTARGGMPAVGVATARGGVSPVGGR